VQLSVLGARMTAQSPRTHQHLRPQVVPYTSTYAELSPSSRAYMLSFNLFVLMLLVLVCSNVALLLFARATARETELVVRSALGATRARIVAQLFAEALVLGAVAATVGLAAAYVVLRRWGMDYLEENLGRLPFWYDVRLSPAAVLYACVLTLLGAAIAGVLPALKITRGLGGRLRQASAGGGGVRFGGVWTAVIIMQVAFTVAFPAVTWVVQRELARVRSFPAGFAAERYLSAWVEMDTPGGTDGAQPDEAARAKFAATLDALRQRLAAEPGVAGVTFVDRLPRTGHVERYVELDERAVAPDRSPSAAAPLREVSTARIDPSYFDVLEAPILAGRRFNAGDLAPDARAVIVDRGFVDQVLQGRSAVGVRVRFAAEQRGGPLTEDERPWYEIVGVVDELGMGAATQRGRAAGFYLPAAPGSTGPLFVVLHARGDPMSLAPRLREITTAVDPALRLSELQRVDQVTSGVLWFLGVWLRITLAMTGIALVLALAGIYSVLSFTVARRTREIGVRVALGRSPRRVVAAVFRRPLTQVGLGVAAGGAVIGIAALAATGGGSPPGSSRSCSATPRSCWACASSPASSLPAAPSASSRRRRSGRSMPAGQHPARGRAHLAALTGRMLRTVRPLCESLDAHLARIPSASSIAARMGAVEAAAPSSAATLAAATCASRAVICSTFLAAKAGNLVRGGAASGRHHAAPPPPALRGAPPAASGSVASPERTDLFNKGGL
jgi:predicted permease